MAAEFIDDTVDGSGLYPTKIPGYEDAADIQEALRLYHYGSSVIPTTSDLNGTATSINTKSVAGHLKSLSNTIATEVTDRTGADTNLQTQITSLLNTINLQTTVTTISSSFTLSLSDAGKTILLDTASTMTLTVPTNSSVEIPIGYQYFVIEAGSGRTTFTPAAGVTINSKNSQMYIDTQYGKATLLKVGTNSWIAYGDIYENVAPTPVAAPVAAPVTPPFFPPAPVTPPVTPPVEPPVTPPVSPVAPPVTPPVSPVAPPVTSPVESPVEAPVSPVALTYCPSLGYNVPSSGYPGNCPGASPVAAPVSPTQYTVTWDANGGTVSPTSNTVNDGVSVTAPTPTRDGYTFANWRNPLSGGDPTIVSAGGSYTPTSNITFYAIWTASTPVAAPVTSGSAYWYTGCCSTTGQQVTGQSSSDFTAAFNSMNSQCSGEVTNTSSGNFGTIPTISCVAAPVAPAPVAPAPVAPAPVAPAPVAPAPVAPAPVAPAPVAPAPVATYCRNEVKSISNATCPTGNATYNVCYSSPDYTGQISSTFVSCIGSPAPAPVAPAPVAPAPVAPAPVAPAPTAPAPVAPAPVAPAPVAPAPVAPAPVAPAPVTGTPVAQTYCPSLGYNVPSSGYPGNCPGYRFDANTINI
jgi:uncharacterized repeat protein (TIGR02543 family)